MSVTSQIKHDFINNSLRIEVINKLICESLEKNENINEEYIEDLNKFIKLHIDLIKHFK